MTNHPSVWRTEEFPGMQEFCAETGNPGQTKINWWLFKRGQNVWHLSISLHWMDTLWYNSIVRCSSSIGHLFKSAGVGRVVRSPTQQSETLISTSVLAAKKETYFSLMKYPLLLNVILDGWEKWVQGRVRKKIYVWNTFFLIFFLKMNVLGV